MKLIITVLSLLCYISIFSQPDEAKPKLESNIVSSISLNNDFNGKDWYLGMSVGAEDLGYEWGARLGFNFRPFYKKTQITDDNNIVRQYREQKYFLSLDLDKRFLHFDVAQSKLQLFAGLKTGFLFGNYKGTQNNSKTYAILAPMAGICFNHDNTFFIKAGYCHFSDRVTEVPDGRITLTLLLAI